MPRCRTLRTFAADLLGGARGRGFEIAPDLVEEASRNAGKAKVGHLVTIEARDISTVYPSSASVV